MTTRPAPARFSVNVRDLRDVNPYPTVVAALAELGAKNERVFTSAYGPTGAGWKQQMMFTNGGGATLAEVRAALALALSTEVEVKVAALAPTAAERRAAAEAAAPAAPAPMPAGRRAYRPGPVDELDDATLARELGIAREVVARLAVNPRASAEAVDAANARLVSLVEEIDGRAPVVVRVELDDARPGDEVWQGGEWTPVAAFHRFGTGGDLVKIVWANGGSLAMPASHCPAIRRVVVDPAPVVEADEPVALVDSLVAEAVEAVDAFRAALAAWKVGGSWAAVEAAAARSAAAVASIDEATALSTRVGLDLVDPAPVVERPLGIVGINRHNYPGRCALHTAYEADYCPVCGTTTPIGDRDQVNGGGTR